MSWGGERRRKYDAARNGWEEEDGQQRAARDGRVKPSRRRSGASGSQACSALVRPVAEEERENQRRVPGAPRMLR